MPKRPQPRFPEPNSQPFWDGCKERELRYQTCDACDNVVFYPRLHCDRCGSADLTWNVSRGEGSVYTFSVIRQNLMPGFTELGAYSVAYIDLDEGFRMFSSVVGIEDPTQDIHIGQRVRVEFEDQEEGEYPIPVFKPI